ncbi:hypothetical protein T439DRAFT_120969 [Meredithblackwellia eburnea MCA 4105]
MSQGEASGGPGQGVGGSNSNGFNAIQYSQTDLAPLFFTNQSSQQDLTIPPIVPGRAVAYLPHSPSLGGSNTQTPISATSTGSNSAAEASGSKGGAKKRSGPDSNAGDEEDDGDEESQKKKRVKTPRACDSCRRSKRRYFSPFITCTWCDALPDVEPPICVYCKAHKLQCTWFLPIAETRFQRKRQPKEDDTGANLPGPPSIPTPIRSASLNNLNRSSNSPPVFTLPVHPGSGPLGSPAYHLDPNHPHSNGSSPNDINGNHVHRKEARIVGPTSISHLMHSTSTFPVDRMLPVDSKYSQTLQVDETGDGFIKVISHGDGEPTEPGGGVVAIQGIERGDAEKLLNYFFATHCSHFPIVSKADFLSSESPTPLLFNAICGISALSHHVSPSILRTIKGTIRATLREEDILDNSSISTIQALLIYAYSLELEKGTAASKTWNILGLAIRMAQDLGLHRKLGSERREQSEADHIELRRRVWGGCLIADRWISAIYGQPMMIDLRDCDCQLPSVFDIRPNLEFDAERKPYLFNSALISLSILLGRVLKAIYSPTGIMTLLSSEAEQLLADLDAWLQNLPPELRFEGPDKSSSEQGFLHLLYIPVRFLVTRPFMRISFQLPERFANISVGNEQWMHVETAAKEAIEWVDKNESCLEGWFVGTYSFFVCSLIQYHGHIRRRDARSLDALRLARDTLKRLVVPDGECHVRAKLAEILHLLYHTACSVSQWAPETVNGTPLPGIAPVANPKMKALNPTTGVRQREQDWHPKDNRPAPAAYSSSLRSTHVPDPVETTEPVNSVTYAASPPQLASQEPYPLNFNPSMGGTTGINSSAPGTGSFFDTFGLGSTDLQIGGPSGAGSGTQTPLFPQEGLFDGGFLDWDSWSSFFSGVPQVPTSGTE